VIGSVLVSAVTTLATLTAPVPVPVNGGGGYGERASAYWIFPPSEPGGGRTFVFTEVYQGANNSGPAAFAIVGLGVCVDYERGGVTSELCRGGGLQHKLERGEFELSPTLDSARLDYAEGGLRQTVSWTAVDRTPSPTPHYGFGARSLAADVELQRRTGAVGSVYGYAVDDSVVKAAILARTLGGGAAFTSPAVAGWDSTRTVDADGRHHLTLTRQR